MRVSDKVDASPKLMPCLRHQVQSALPAHYTMVTCSHVLQQYDAARHFAYFRGCSKDIPPDGSGFCAGQWSPKPLDAEHVAGQEVVTEEEDMRLLELQRAQASPWNV